MKNQKIYNKILTTESKNNNLKLRTINKVAAITAAKRTYYKYTQSHRKLYYASLLCAQFKSRGRLLACHNYY